MQPIWLSVCLFIHFSHHVIILRENANCIFWCSLYKSRKLRLLYMQSWEKQPREMIEVQLSLLFSTLFARFFLVVVCFIHADFDFKFETCNMGIILTYSTSQKFEHTYSFQGFSLFLLFYTL
jgi:hypothetical protein